MKAGDLGRLIALAAIWGASFLLTRVVAPQIGPLGTAEARLLIGGGALAAYFWAIGYDPQWRRWWAQYTFVGLINSALPFLLFAYAALELSAGMLSVLNATSPMWAAVCSAILLGERLTGRRAVGLAFGIVGVALVTGVGERFYPLASLAAVGAAFLYGLAGAYMRKWTRDAPAQGMAMGTQLLIGILFIPLLAVSPRSFELTPALAANVLAFGLLCNALAYVVYFRLVADVGATGALTVTYLIPVFGVAWGALFLDEPLTLQMLGGAALVILGTFFVLKK